MTDKRIYMIGGVGNVGKLVAHSLRNIPDPPAITLLVHTQALLEQWEASKKVITLQKDGKELEASGYDVEVMPEHNQPDDKSDEPIQNLLVITKAAFTVPNLIRVAHRLTRDSTICFLQNGMGIVEEVNERIFSDAATRPNYMQGIITHGMNTPPEIIARDPFYAVHGGSGAIYIALLPRSTSSPSTSPDEVATWPETAKHVLKTMTASPVLAAVGVTSADLVLSQLQKLAVNAIINPITSLIDGPNGALLNNDALISMTRLLLSEISSIFTKLPELQDVPDASTKLSAATLEETVIKQCEGTPHNISSMLSDIRIGQQTETGYINGYIVRRAKDVGVEATANYAIMQLVLARQQIVEQEMKKKQGSKL